MFGSGIDRCFELDNVDLLFFSNCTCVRVRPSERAEMDWKIGGITLFKKKKFSLFRMDNLCTVLQN